MRHIRPMNLESDLLRERLHDNARLVLRPDFRMRRDSHFVSFWRVGDDAGVWDFCRMDPSLAILTSLFNGKRTVAEVVRDFCSVAGVAEAAVRDALAGLAASKPDCLVPAGTVPSDQWQRYDPLSFVIPFGDVDMRGAPAAPLSLVWMITNHCNVDCIYCFAERQRYGTAGPPMPLRRIMEIIEEASLLGVSGVLMEGGDPFLHPHIVEIVGALISRQIHVAISTKCELSEEVIRRLFEVGLRRLQVSIDTVDERIYSFLTRAPASHLHGTLATARRAASAGLATLANAVATPYTLAGMQELTAELVALGVTSIRFSAYTPSLYSPRDDLVLSADQARQFSEAAKELDNRYPHVSVSFREDEDLPFEQRAICTAGLYGLTIYPDGKVVLCEQLPSTESCVVGNLSRQSLKDVWDSDTMMVFRTPDRTLFRGTVCESCEDFDECNARHGRCFVKSLKAFGSLFGPVPKCPRVPTRTANSGRMAPYPAG